MPTARHRKAAYVVEERPKRADSRADFAREIARVIFFAACGSGPASRSSSPSRRGCGRRRVARRRRVRADSRGDYLTAREAAAATAGRAPAAPIALPRGAARTSRAAAPPLDDRVRRARRRCCSRRSRRRRSPRSSSTTAARRCRCASTSRRARARRSSRSRPSAVGSAARDRRVPRSIACSASATCRRRRRPRSRSTSSSRRSSRRCARYTARPDRRGGDRARRHAARRGVVVDPRDQATRRSAAHRIDEPEGMALWTRVPPGRREDARRAAAAARADRDVHRCSTSLIDNADRWSGNNTQGSPDGKTLYFMDNTLSFSTVHAAATTTNLDAAVPDPGVPARRWSASCAR